MALNNPWIAGIAGLLCGIISGFGIGGGREYTQKEVADSLGISQSYISRLEKRIIEKIKREV